MNRYKKFLIIMTLSIFLSLTLLALFNYKIDSAGLFHKSNLMQQAAQEILKGKIVAGLGDEAFDDRQFQISLIHLIQQKVDIIATGSSRTKELRSGYLENARHTFFNHAVNGASMEDYIAILGAYKKFHGYLPKEVILGVDPWILNKNNGRVRWKNIQNYHEFSNLIMKKQDKETKSSSLKKFQELFNASYTLANIRFFLKTLKRSKGYYIVDTTDTDDFLRDPDASIRYPYATRFPNRQAVALKAKKYTQGYVYGLENFDYADTKQHFVQLMQNLKNAGVHVTLFLAPYHPITYDILSQNPKYRLKEVQHYFQTFAKKHHLQIVGSYNPHDLNLTGKDFFDGMHCNDHIMKQIFHSWHSANAAL
jgi:hypothetical protein